MRSRTSSGWSRSRRSSSRFATRCRQPRPRRARRRRESDVRSRRPIWSRTFSRATASPPARPTSRRRMRSTARSAGRRSRGRGRQRAGVDLVCAHRQSRSVDARRLLPQLESDLLDPGDGSRKTCRRSRRTSRPDGLTTFDWGLMVYTGWPAVENVRHRARRCVDADDAAGTSLRKRPGRAGHRAGLDQIHRSDDLRGQADVSAGADEEQGSPLGVHRSISRTPATRATGRIATSVGADAAAAGTPPDAACIGDRSRQRRSARPIGVSCPRSGGERCARQDSFAICTVHRVGALPQ